MRGDEAEEDFDGAEVLLLLVDVVGATKLLGYVLELDSVVLTGGSELDEDEVLEVEELSTTVPTRLSTPPRRLLDSDADWESLDVVLAALVISEMRLSFKSCRLMCLGK